MACVALFLVGVASYFGSLNKPGGQVVSIASSDASGVTSTPERNVPTSELRHCTTNSVNPFTGSLPAYCFGAPSMATNENPAQTSNENQDNIDASNDVGLTERVSLAMSGIRRGDFKSAMDYAELTDDCRTRLAVYGPNAETKSCSSQDLNFLDKEITSSLIMGVNQRNPEAEVAWSRWWFNQAMVNFEKFKFLDNISATELTDAQRSQMQEFKDAFTRDMNISKDVLAQAQGHNPKADEQMKELVDSGLLTAFSVNF